MRIFTTHTNTQQHYIKTSYMDSNNSDNEFEKYGKMQVHPSIQHAFNSEDSQRSYSNFCEYFRHRILSKSGEKCRIWGQNFIYNHNKSMAYTTQKFRKLSNIQWRFVLITFTEFDSHR